MLHVEEPGKGIYFFLLEAVGPEQKRALPLPHPEYLTPFHGFFTISITRAHCTSFLQWVVLSSDIRWMTGKVGRIKTRKNKMDTRRVQT
jgi:hypothetical protein